MRSKLACLLTWTSPYSSVKTCLERWGDLCGRDCKIHWRSWKNLCLQHEVWGQPMMVTTGARKLQMVQKAHTYAFLSLLVSLLFFFFLQGSKYRCMCFFRCFYASLIAERSCYMFVVPYRQTESEGWETHAVVLCQKRKLWGWVLVLKCT